MLFFLCHCVEVTLFLQESVVGGLSKRTRDAIDTNEDVKEAGVRRKIQQEILGGSVAYLQLVFGDDTPSK